MRKFLKVTLVTLYGNRVLGIIEKGKSEKIKTKLIENGAKEEDIVLLDYNLNEVKIPQKTEVTSKAEVLEEMVSDASPKGE